MKPVILYRGGRECMDEEELEAASEHFDMVPSRMNIGKDHLVIGRYSVLPFYRELEHDIQFLGSRMINTYAQHLYVADLQNWVADLGSYTPKTWSSLEGLPSNMAFVLKGATNSKKFQWKTHMFAEDKAAACDVYGRLCEDGLISQQQIYIREYVPLTTYFNDVVGLPVTKEFRFFVYDEKIISGGYYWSSHADVLEERAGGVPSIDEVPLAFLRAVIKKIGKKVMFYALDVAEAAGGGWIVIELNDGQMSGLSMNDPHLLYAQLAERLK